MNDTIILSIASFDRDYYVLLLLFIVPLTRLIDLCALCVCVHSGGIEKI